MAVIYRAIWQDDRAGLEDLVHTAFVRWLESKHPGLDLQTEINESTSATDGRRITVSALSSEGEGGEIATELVLREDSDSERWTTTVRTSVGEDLNQWVWVDVERTTANPWSSRPHVAAPRLVRDLIDEARNQGGDPRWGSIRLGAKAVAISPERVREHAVNRLKSPGRLSPEIVFAHGFDGGPAATMERADRTAKRLAGVASVLVLPEQTVPLFNAAMGQGEGVDYGQARLYLPRTTNNFRDHVLEAPFVSRHTSAAAIQFGLLLQPSLSNRKPPPALDEALKLLRIRVGQNHDELLQLAEEEIDSAQQQVSGLQGELQQAREEVIDQLIEIEDRDEQIAQLLRLTDSYRIGSGDLPASVVEVPVAVDSMASALDEARVHLSGIVVPPGIECDIAELDQAPAARTWANGLWRGLRALDAYASSTESGGGGFREWCQLGRAYAWSTSSKKYAAVESDSVRQNPDFRNQRVLPVSSQVDESGEVFMEQHLKIAEGGGEQAPRVYFYDDSAGTTGKVHVGFVGPHRHMRNTRTT
ncbi:MAG: hypothetical protein OTJ97_10170 [SAR202 cluster bacterium]|nr:hypothetical protein [SAR202 cluster bacterium]